MNDLRTLEYLKSHLADLHGGATVDLCLNSGVLTLRGEVDSIIDKRRIARLAARVAGQAAGVRQVQDCLRRKPKQLMADREILAILRDTLLQQSPFDSLVADTAAARPAPRPQARQDYLDIEVALGLVRLRGCVPGLDLKRLAGVFAWWVPGTCEVRNEIEVRSPSDGRHFSSLAESVRLVLERDPLIDAGSIRVGVSGYEVTLAGPPLPALSRRVAEEDAWYVFGVEEVRNLISHLE